MTNLALVIAVPVLLAVVCLLIGRIWELERNRKLGWMEWVERREQKRRSELALANAGVTESGIHHLDELVTVEGLMLELEKIMAGAKERRYGCLHWSEIDDLIQEYKR